MALLRERNSRAPRAVLAGALAVLVSLEAAPSAFAQKAPPPAPPPLDGASYDFDYDGRDVGHAERAWLGRAFVHRRAAAVPAGEALPLLVFLHGNNADKIKYRWMGGGQEGDLRRIVAELIEA